MTPCSVVPRPVYVGVSSFFGGGLIAQHEKDRVERWELVLEVNKNYTCALISAAKDVRISDRYYRYSLKSSSASLGGFDTSRQCHCVSLFLSPKLNSSFTGVLRNSWLWLCPRCAAVTQPNTDSSETSGGENLCDEEEAFRNQLGMSSACVRECASVWERAETLRFPGLLIGPERALKLTTCGVFKTKRAQPAHSSAVTPCVCAFVCVCIPCGKLPAPVGPGICHGASGSQRQCSCCQVHLDTAFTTTQYSPFAGAEKNAPGTIIVWRFREIKRPELLVTIKEDIFNILLPS